MQKIMLVMLILLSAGCAHSGAASKTNPQINVRETLGYAQIKTPYANAAWDEGKMAGVKMALDNRHSKTGKPYPCWNALKPFHGKNMPVSLKLSDASDPNLQTIVRLGQFPINKLDSLGKDGVISTSVPTPKPGYTIWKVDQIYQKANRSINKPVIGLVDISESMKASAKFRTLVGLKDSNIQFEKIYVFSTPGSVSEVSLADIAHQSPRGYTAIYDNLKVMIAQNPGSEFVVVTDGKDNKSKTSMTEVQNLASESGSVVDIVLTGKNASDAISALAYKTGGQVMRDIQESGQVIQPLLDVALVR